MMPAGHRIEESQSEAVTGSQADKVRAGVTGHNVRYVLAFGLGGCVLAFAVVSYLASQGWL
jgi:hypothetical protein